MLCLKNLKFLSESAYGQLLKNTDKATNYKKV